MTDKKLTDAPMGSLIYFKNNDMAYIKAGTADGDQNVVAYVGGKYKLAIYAVETAEVREVIPRDEYELTLTIKPKVKKRKSLTIERWDTDDASFPKGIMWVVRDVDDSWVAYNTREQAREAVKRGRL